MNIQMLWLTLTLCTIINYVILLAWFLLFLAARKEMKSIHGIALRLSDEQFDAIHYAGMAIYKVGILLFNLVPAIAMVVADSDVVSGLWPFA